MDTLLSVCVGIGLSAACGFRVFLPLLGLGLAARGGYLEITPTLAWVAGDAALIALAVATVLEIGAYYVPWLDHLLDAAASPMAVAAGVIASASVLTEVDPWLRWTLAAIAGGGAAGTVQALTVGTRKLSLFTTAGIANPLVSTIELGGSMLMTLLAIVVPLIAVFVLVIFAGAAFAVLRAVRARRNP